MMREQDRHTREAFRTAFFASLACLGVSFAVFIVLQMALLAAAAVGGILIWDVPAALDWVIAWEITRLLAIASVLLGTWIYLHERD
jgi:hypothetical protein